MQQILKTWSGLETGKKVVVALAVAALLAAIIGLGRMATKPSMTLLYAGIEATAAGEIIQALEQRSILHEVRGGAIYVESSARDMLRMTLAAEGLPANNMQGYELLDNLTGFGTTSQMFDAAYWRAKEGELARTIVSSPTISSARVHVSTSGNNPFQRQVSPSASVTVTTTVGVITATQANAIKYLVASAVPGLKPDDVAIIDSVGGLVTATQDTSTTTTGTDRSADLRDRVLRLLEARVGAGNAMVEVDITTETTSETLRERIVDPSSRVAISSDTEESSNDATGSDAGTVTVASNLPDGDGAEAASSRSSNSLSRERINYEISETSREVLRSPGAVKRITVAVLVNGSQQTNAEGEVIFQPRSEEELLALRDLVSSAVGLDESRGDLVTLKSLEFLKERPMGTQVESNMYQSLGLDMMALIQMAVLALVALVLGFFVLKPILLARTESLALPTDTPPSRLALGKTNSSDIQMRALDGEIADDDFEFQALPVVQARSEPETDGGVQINSDPVARLRNLIAERQDETVEILRGWLEDRGEKA